MPRHSKIWTERSYSGWRQWRRLLSDIEGAAAIEFGLMIGLLSIALLNMVDVAQYYYARTAVENATQMATQSAWKTCDPTKLPATTNCPAFQTAVSTGAHSTTLGAAVVVQQGSPSEAYYCVDTNGVLTRVSNVSSKPADCSAWGSADQPADYIKVQTSYIYHPIFTGVSIGSLLPSAITSTSMMRMQ